MRGIAHINKTKHYSTNYVLVVTVRYCTAPNMLQKSDIAHITILLYSYFSDYGGYYVMRNATCIFTTYGTDGILTVCGPRIRPMDVP